ncbi:hypothetical protein P4E94_19760 [Pontiellaceae bacterium B12219]|nr:hypothetical protein [Pontiellaceae bacterium B12219]
MKQNDQTRAKRLLKMQAEGARFRWNYILKSKWLWIALVVIGALVAGAVMTPEDVVMNRVIFCLLGILIGRILRDMIWLKDIVDAFPFTEKIINWDKVKEIANK